MRHPLVTVPMLVALATPLHAQVPPASPADVVTAFHAALHGGNGDAALALLDSAVIVYESGGVEASRDEYRAHHLGADMQFSAGVTREVTSQRTVMSGEVAWVLTESRTLGTFGEREIDVLGTETMLLRRTVGGWRIVHIHWSSGRARG
jgi:ketosteroid isomerase-like protein